MNVGTLTALLSIDHAKFDRGLDKAHANAEGFATKTGGSFRKFALAGAAAFAAVAGAAIGFFGDATKQAEDNIKAADYFTRIYGKAGDAVESWNKQQAAAYGVSDTEALKAEASIGMIAKAMGFTQAQASGMSEQLLKTAANLAAMKNIPVSDALSAITRGLAGQTRGLKQMGIVITPIMIKQEAMTLGLYKGKGALSDHAKAAASYALILQRGAVANGEFAKGQNDLSNQLKVAGAEWSNLMDTAGRAIMPLVTAVLPSLLGALQTFSNWVDGNGPLLRTIVSTAMDGVRTAFKLAGVAIDWISKNVVPVLVTVFQFVVNKVIPQLVGAINWVSDNVVPALGTAFQWISDNVLPALATAFDFVANLFGGQGQMIAIVVGTVLVAAFGAWAISAAAAAAATLIALAPVIAVIAVVALVFKALQLTWQVYGDKIKAGIGVVANFIGTAFDNLKLGIKTAWDFIVNIVTTAINIITAPIKLFASLVSGLFNVVPQAIKTAINAVIGIVNGVIDAVDSVKLSVHVGPVNWDWSGVGVPKFSYLASGTPSFNGGWAVVGEKGPELAKLPGGTAVYPHGRSQQMLDGAGGGAQSAPRPIQIYQTITGADPEEVTTATKRALRQASLETSLAGGLG